MEFGRISALMLAVIAAVLVVVAGKSCADDAIRENERSKASKRSNNKIATIAQDTRQEFELAVETSPSEPEEEIQYEVVTNMVGDVIETIPITTAEEEEDAAATTGTKSILEAYEDLHTVPTEEGSMPEATTSRYIEPATKIVINLD